MKNKYEENKELLREKYHAEIGRLDKDNERIWFFFKLWSGLFSVLTFGFAFKIFGII